jgi:hypothetical protein
MKPLVIFAFAAGLVALALLGSMVDVVHVEGDHVSFLVLAPCPTPGFVYGGGEEGAWRRAHPGEVEPWWLRGDYVILAEVTDG